MFNPIRRFKQNMLKKRLAKQRIARRKFLQELVKPGSTKLRNTRKPLRLTVH